MDDNQDLTGENPTDYEKQVKDIAAKLNDCDPCEGEKDEIEPNQAENQEIGNPETNNQANPAFFYEKVEKTIDNSTLPIDCPKPPIDCSIHENNSADYSKQIDNSIPQSGCSNHAVKPAKKSHHATLSLDESTFVKHYMETKGNATEASRRCGMEDVSASYHAYKMLNRPKVRAAIKERTAQVVKRHAITQERLIEQVLDMVKNGDSTMGRAKAAGLLGKWLGLDLENTLKPQGSMPTIIINTQQPQEPKVITPDATQPEEGGTTES